MLDQPGGIVGDDVAFRLGLIDDVVGDRLDEEVLPGGILDGAGSIELEERLCLLRRDGGVIIESPPELQDIAILDAATRTQLRN